MRSMLPGGLIDTGAMIALLDSSESRHQVCLEALARYLPLLTTEAVLTELFRFVQERSLNLDAAWRFVRSGAVQLEPMSDGALPELHALMEKYADRPMDFADATLVHLAGSKELSTILTLDHNDFETYRLPGGKKFRIVPAPRQG
jgi:uncharacterized protein